MESENTVPQIQPSARKEHIEMAEKPQMEKKAFRLIRICALPAKKGYTTHTNTQTREEALLQKKNHNNNTHKSDDEIIP